MTTSSTSCSFRITRTAEDLAQTITSLSQRLVKIEQRQEALEMQLAEYQQEPPDEEMRRLDGVEQLLKECQELLDSSSPISNLQDTNISEEVQDDFLAA